MYISLFHCCAYKLLRPARESHIVLGYLKITQNDNRQVDLAEKMLHNSINFYYA